jgi:hypothetical protein
MERDNDKKMMNCFGESENKQRMGEVTGVVLNRDSGVRIRFGWAQEGEVPLMGFTANPSILIWALT